MLLYVHRHPNQVGNVELPQGTVTYAHYWIDRPYNVYHWVEPDGGTVAYYVNLADQVTITPAAVAWRDLAVDLLFTLDGHVQVLDEGELVGATETLRATVTAIQLEVLKRREAIIGEVTAATARVRKALRQAGQAKRN